MDLPAKINASWLPVIRENLVRQAPVARTIAGIAIVLWRSGDQIVAFKDRCPHRNYPLSKGRTVGNALQCPYHGWSFGADGSCLDIPGCGGADRSRLGAEVVAVSVFDGIVFVNFDPQDDIASGLPPMPDADDIDHFWWAIKPQQARIYDALDNVLDAYHTNFIHDGYIRVKSQRQRVEQTIDVFEDHFSATYVQEADKGWMSRALEGDRAFSRGTYFPPVAFQGWWEGKDGLSLCVTIWFVPTHQGFMAPFVRFSSPKSRGSSWLKEAMIRLFLGPVIAQDAHALKALSDTIAHFGGPKFKAGPEDRLSGFLSKLYMGQSLMPQKLGPFELWL